MAPSFPQCLFSDVLGAVPEAEVRGDGTVGDVCFDSRELTPGALFFCVPGAVVDGHDLAASAVDLGASALVVERWLELDVPQAKVASVRRAMGPISARAFGDPATAMTMLGVTGTNGKTTTTYVLEGIIGAAGYRAGVIGTTGARADGVPVPLVHTTPEAPDLHRLLARMRDAGVEMVAMEVSSHALHQHRVGGVMFDAVAFTNLSQDHLDYHPSMEAYFAAKAELFTPQRARRGSVNVDDPWGRRLLQSATIECSTFGSERDADLRATDVVSSRDGLEFTVGERTLRSGLRARFNVSNVLAAMSLARTVGIPEATVAEGVASVARVPGRVEVVDAGQRPLVVVDYAHTPDSIQHVLQAARPLTTGRLIVVFGCGGDRDRAKRPQMGQAATENADLSIITSDNPRLEDPLEIIAEIEPGAIAGGGAFRIEPDRRAAIRAAVREAGADDTVVIAGKGHEVHQELADGAIRFDDREVVREELVAMREDA